MNTAFQEEIQARAYQLWMARGCPIGSEAADWYEAEQQLQREQQATTPNRRRGKTPTQAADASAADLDL